MSLTEQLKAVQAALEGLNREIDSYWNQGRSESQVKLIAQEQQNCKGIVANMPALTAQVGALEKDNADLLHDLGRQMAIGSELLADNASLKAQVEALEGELAAIKEWLGPVVLPPEGKRTKLDEMHACYAMLFQQLNALAAKANSENAALKARLAEAQR